MKKSFLKFLAAVLLVPFTFSGCGSSSKSDNMRDTTFLASGVKYLYLEKGNGTAVDSGSHVTTHINLMIGADTVWSTHHEGQEQFEFDAKRTSLISGFDEVVMYAKAGDRILAIIPPEHGYGEEGAGDDIPPNSTLIFDLEFLKVEEPKSFLSDVLFLKIEAEGLQAALDEYELIKEDTATYNLNVNEWYTLHRKVMRENRYQDALGIWEYKLKEGPLAAGSYYKAQAYDSLGQIKSAISTLETALGLEEDTSSVSFLNRYLNQLKSR